MGTTAHFESLTLTLILYLSLELVPCTCPLRLSPELMITRARRFLFSHKTMR